MLLINIAVIILVLYLMAIVCDHYFIGAIDIMANKLKLSSDAAGATLLAIGSSAPEFFTALFAVFGASTSDIGAGTIVGSAIFNILVIVGASATFKTVSLQWKPVLRDMLFYVLTIVLLLIFFIDGKIHLYEAAVFVAVYIFYVFAVSNWRKWFHYEDTEPIEEKETKIKGSIRALIIKIADKIIKKPKTTGKIYIRTFIVSLIIVAGLSHVLVSNASQLASALNINPAFVALTVLAAGTSIPDLMGSVLVAKQGRGDMAVGNAVGSNIFDILMGLGMI